MPVTKQHAGRVVAAPARCKRYNIPDSELKGLGLRVEPRRQDGGGHKAWYVQAMAGGRRVYKTIGTAPEMSLAEAQKIAHPMLAQIRAGQMVPVPGCTPSFAEVAEEVFRRHGRRWKPRTMRVNRDYLKSCLLPVFGAMPIEDISAADVQAWFAGLRDRPGAANRSAPILSVTLDRAMAYGYLPEGSNPCAGSNRFWSYQIKFVQVRNV